jgi:hypothetical protein
LHLSGYVKREIDYIFGAACSGSSFAVASEAQESSYEGLK